MFKFGINSKKKKKDSRSWLELEGKVKKKYKGTLFLFNGIKTASMFKKKKDYSLRGQNFKSIHISHSNIYLF